MEIKEVVMSEIPRYGAVGMGLVIPKEKGDLCFYADAIAVFEENAQLIRCLDRANSALIERIGELEAKTNE